MTPNRLFLFILVLYLSGFIIHAALLGKAVYGDGIFYFSWLRSSVVDHNLIFANEYEHFGTSQPQTPLNIPGNKYGPGAALLWAPAYIAVHSIIRGDGYGLPYQYAAGVTSVLAAVAGLVLVFDTLCKYFSSKSSMYATTLVALGTNLWFYGSLDPANSHAMSFFLSAALLSLLFKTPKPNAFSIGLTVGIGALTRTQDAINGILALPKSSVKNIMFVFVGFAAGFAPQLIAWKLVYGTFLASPYVSDIEGFNLATPRVLGVLFHPNSGWFLWTPAVIIGILGLLLLTRNKHTQLRILIIPVLLQVYLVSSWSTWWQGASFSGRMFVSALPFLAFGFAQSIEYIKKQWSEAVVLWGTIIFSLGNAAAMIYFLVTG